MSDPAVEHAAPTNAVPAGSDGGQDGPPELVVSSIDASVTYMDAFRELEEILAALERPDLDVDALADRVARAEELVRHCRSKVDGARFKLKVIAEQR